MSPSNSPSEMEPLNRTQILGVMGFTAVLLLIIAKLWQWWGDVTLLRISLNAPDALIGVGLAVAIILASGLIYRLWPAYRASADVYLAFVIKPLVWADLLWLGLLPGLSEELLFRGVMLSALGAGGLAVVVSSLVFGVLHLSSAEQWPYVVWATVVGLVLGYGAIASGNLLVPIVAHILTNWVSSALWKFNHRQG
ncbi:MULTISPECIES: type II CAAX prenyl endopeptidase Rce1 family protein [Synechocystis]|uniref:CPBP family intramembrane metalloprotease n=1 Tax=Synechocystis salina LEGE 00031 TaxID=1828736 RepID=A0ABR9VMR3_9SYNC|nr:CPBP family intramembrane metalloprotease [Synechocystis sp. FACHB-383]MBE9194176.1 CPBP family intramembrane metalloprotease [Synechocystis sp. LEGE 06083]MBE9240871.1 CPBP family intramembrane metalloprotease [Synechocystis salina LEGE 00041]MBE9252619.1 CPBP family intramembrane metalloprotease [Synechocystis salina LEGE 00031]